MSPSVAPSLRDAGAADASAIARLHIDSWLASYRGVLSDDYLDGRMPQDKVAFWTERLVEPKPGDVVLTAWDGDTLVGFACAWMDPALYDGAYLYSLHARPGSRGRGVGRRLFAETARRMKALGAEQIWLHVFSGNLDAIRFYERLGGARGLTMRTEAFGGVTRDRTFFWDDLDALAAWAETPITQPGPVSVRAETVEEVIGAGHPVAAVERAQGRRKQRLGDLFGLDQYGVNRVTVPPGVWSTVRHWHSHEDEFVYVLAGEFVLVTERGETVLSAGDCAGFKAGVADGHRLENRTASEAVYLEVGSRRPDVDEVIYPEDDLMIRRDAEGRQWFTRHDGTVIQPAD